MYKVILTKEQREELTSILRKGKHTWDQYLYARLLLNIDEGKYSDGPANIELITQILRIDKRTIERVKKKFVEEGFDSLIKKSPKPAIKKKKETSVSLQIQTRHSFVETRTTAWKNKSCYPVSNGERKQDYVMVTKATVDL